MTTTQKVGGCVGVGGSLEICHVFADSIVFEQSIVGVGVKKLVICGFYKWITPNLSN